MIDLEKRLAKVNSEKLSIQERGILTFYITVSYECGWCQGIGGITLDTWDEEKESRVGTAYGCEMIRRLLLEFDVDDFHEMAGKYMGLWDWQL